MLNKSEISKIISHFGEGRLDSVLEKTPSWFDTQLDTELPRLARLWILCGNDKKSYLSLRQINDGLKSPQAQELFTFLNTLIK